MSVPDTNKAWLAGWDAGISGTPGHANPYRRSDFRRAWDRGRTAGLRSSDQDVANMQRRVAASKEIPTTILRSVKLPDSREAHLIAVKNEFPMPFYVAVANMKVHRRRRYNAGRGQYFRTREEADQRFDEIVSTHPCRGESP